MSVFDCPPPRFSDAELGAIAKTRFGLTGAIKRLDSERDQNAPLQTPDGDFVLKVANAAEEKALIDLQNATLLHLAGADSDLRLTRLIPTVDGNPYSGAYRGMTADTGRAYARTIAECAQRIQARTGTGPACFIAESISGVGGQVVYPPGYLEEAYAAVLVRNQRRSGEIRTGR